MYIRIYKEKKSATQSHSGGNKWILEAVPSFENTFQGDMTGCNGSRDTQKQIILKFRDCESAMEYANSHGMKIINNCRENSYIKQEKKNYLKNFQS